MTSKLLYEWCGVRDYPNYRVSDEGLVENIKTGRLLKPRKDGWGSQIVNLSRNGVVKNFKIHRLVAEAFIPNIENKPEVNHKDGNRQNNKVENLEWVTRQENESHAFRTGIKKPWCSGKHLSVEHRNKISKTMKKVLKK